MFAEFGQHTFTLVQRLVVESYIKIYKRRVFAHVDMNTLKAYLQHTKVKSVIFSSG